MPDRWFFLPIDRSNVRVMSFLAMMESTSAAAPASGLMTIDSWLSAAEGDASGLWFASLAGEFMLPETFVWGQYAAAGSIDSPAARDYFADGTWGRDPNLGRASSVSTCEVRSVAYPSASGGGGQASAIRPPPQTNAETSSAATGRGVRAWGDTRDSSRRSRSSG